MSSQTRYEALFLTAGLEMQCGVGQFTRKLRDSMARLAPGAVATLTLTNRQGSMAEIWRAVGAAPNVICNFPIVAWKRVILKPMLALMLARLRGRSIVLMQHEWGGLHWLRRLTCMPALLLAERIVVFSPVIRRELADDALIGWTARKCVLAPLPPNVAAPDCTADSDLRRRLAAAKAEGRLIIGHFGSIYPGKQPGALLAIGARLKQQGSKPLIVYIGSFIRGMDQVESEFYARAAELGVADDVIVSGYIASDQELFGIFSEIDAFCYLFEEGLTARRSSILACVQSGRPVIVTAPANPNEFDHHPRYKALIGRGAIIPVPGNAGEDAYARAIVAAIRRPAAAARLDVEAWWRDVAELTRSLLARDHRGLALPAPEIAPDSATRIPPAGT